MSGDSLENSEWAPELIGKKVTGDPRCLDAHRFEQGTRFPVCTCSRIPRGMNLTRVLGRMYGVTLAQTICYAFWFPDDSWLIKALVCSF